MHVEIKEESMSGHVFGKFCPDCNIRYIDLRRDECVVCKKPFEKYSYVTKEKPVKKEVKEMHALNIIKQLKELNLNPVERSKVLSRAYTIALDEKKVVEDVDV